MKGEHIRKIASNYIFMPGKPLVKNGYVVISPSEPIEVVDTGGQLKEIAGLEFYGGMIVPAYVCDFQMALVPKEKMLPLLEQLYAEKGNIYSRVALIEGADLKELCWQTNTRIRLL